MPMKFFITKKWLCRLFNLPEIWRVYHALKADKDPYESAKTELLADLDFEKAKSEELDRSIKNSIDKLIENDIPTKTQEKSV